MSADASITWPAPFWPDDPPPADVLWPSEGQPWSPALVEHYLDRCSSPGDLVLDPFASQAALLVAASAGRRRLAVNNASPATLLGVLASAALPAADVVDQAFSRIADAPRRGRTLAHHLAALYETLCPECAQPIAADRFVWDRSVGEPVEKRYRCPHCGSHGDAPVDMADVAHVSALEVRGAAYWGLLSRLVKPGDPLTERARSLQDLYPPRALLVISELLTAAEQRLSDAETQRAGRAMLLHVLAAGLSSVDLRVDAGTNRLLLPRRSVERNLWLAFEQAHRALRGRSAGEPARKERRVSLAADLARLRAPDGEGRVLPLTLATPELAERLGPGAVTLILTEPPPFDPAAYALQVLWTGWLFGREAVNRQRAVLSIEAWSWDWYARAMATALRTLRPLLKADGRLVLVFADRSPRRGLALLAAASAAGWQLTAQTTQAPLEGPESPVQWRFELKPVSPPAQDVGPGLADRLQRSAQEATFQLLETRGEPAPRALVQTACAVRWSELGLLTELGQYGEASRRPMSYLLAQMRLALDPDLPPPGLSYEATAANGAGPAGQWSLEQAPAQPPLADRVEHFVARQLEGGPATPAALRQAVYAAFPGWLTPDAALVAACLESYGQPDGGLLRLRDEDQPQRRNDDRAELLRSLAALGGRLGLEVWLAPEAARLIPDLETPTPMIANGEPRSDTGPSGELLATRITEWAPANVVWHEGGEPVFSFAVVSQALLHPWLATPADGLAGSPRYVALPGGRAGLLDCKLRRCPAWRTRLAWSGWEFVKFRHLRELARQQGLSLAGFRARVGLDPIVTLPGQQLALFETETQGDADEA